MAASSPSAMAHTQTTLSTSPRDVIEHVRRYEFGLGASLEGDGRIVVDNMVRRYRNLLATIAEDLNSKDSHFILELVQNADDNHYDENVAPSLAFSLEPDRLIVVNNERGFTADNVKALCSAGESSKKNKTGYIGEKGIGFKSVFKVTDTPAIHSNGYHFHFNRSDPLDLLGYVVPHWQEPGFPIDETATTVVLPAKPGREFSTELLAEVNATLLLFLDKLRMLEVRTGKDTVRYLRVDKEATTTLVTTYTSSEAEERSTQRMFLRTKTSVDMSDIAEPKREAILASDLVLAFPLTTAGDAAPTPACPTYAFLPIREFGFNFCIQGDFVLISSREGIHEDLQWNKRLRDAIAPGFIAALQQFKASSALAKNYLRFLPGESEVLDPFFKPAVLQIVNALKDIACVPVESGGWRKPAEVLLAPPAIHDLFTSDDVQTLFGADYPDPSFVAPQGGLQRLSCRSLLISEVLAVFVAHNDWFSKRSLEWKANFYAYIATSPKRQDFIKAMLKLPCLPITGGQMISPEEGVVFYPLNTNRQYGFEHELLMLDSELYDRALAICAEVRALFDSLNVHQDNPLELVRSHILKRHTSEGIATADQGALLGHVRYIRDKLDQYVALAGATQTEAEALQSLRDGLFLGTKKTDDDIWIFDRPTALYLSKDYQPSFDIEGLLGVKLSSSLLVSEKYVLKQTKGANKDETTADLEHWRRFFIRIGVTESPKVVKFDTGDVKCSDELVKLLQSNEQSVRRATLECLNNNWSTYDLHATFQVRTGRSYTAEQTQFVKQLRATLAPTKRRATVSLDQAYRDVGDVKELLGGNVVFIDASVNDERFLKICGITYKVDANGCVKRLRQLRNEGGGTREQIRDIYRRLEILWSSEKSFIEHAFLTEPLIFVRSGDKAFWSLPADVCWRPTNLRFLDARHPSLQSQYTDHSAFFTKLLSVPLELPVAAWVDGLEALPTVEDEQERLDVALSIYRRLSRELSQLATNPRTTIAPTWLARFKSQTLFLDHRGNLVPNSTLLFANDSPEQASLFTDIEGISLLGTPREQLSAVANFLQQTGVRYLSASLNVEVQAGIKGILDEILTRKLNDMFGCIARVVYAQSHERFEMCVKEQLFDTLRHLKVFTVPELRLEVSLGTVTRIAGGNVARRGDELLLQEDAPSHVDYVAMEVRKLLRLPITLSDTISRLLISPSVRDAEAFLSVRNISVLPPEEAAALAGLTSATDPIATMEDESPLEPTMPGAVLAALAEHSPSNEADSTTRPPPVSTAHGQATAAISDTRDAPLNPKDPLAMTPNALATTAGETRDINSPAPADTINSPEEKGAKVSNHPELVHSKFPVSTPLWPGGKSGLPGGTSGPKRRPGKTRSMRTKKGRLLSYAEPGEQAENGTGPDAEQDTELNKRKRAIEQAAVRYFMEQAVGKWRSLREMPHENPGFDISAVALDGAEEVIEVKGQSGAWTEEGVALTPTELAKAQAMRSRYWLCVVEYALDDNRRQLWLVRNPFGLTSQFRFDKGWKAMAETVATKPQRPEAGLFIQIPGDGKGRIVKVKGNGQFAKLHIEFQTGKQIFSKLFNPATMTLSTE